MPAVESVAESSGTPCQHQKARSQNQVPEGAAEYNLDWIRHCRCRGRSSWLSEAFRGVGSLGVVFVSRQSSKAY